jgi:hypothetical protein
MFLHPKDEPNTNLFIFLGLAHLLFFFVITMVCFFVGSYIPASVTIGKKILDRIVAITIICCYSSLLGSILFLFVMQTLWYGSLSLSLSLTHTSLTGQWVIRTTVSSCSTASSSF